MNPKISIVLPVYNGERYIKQSIDSVLRQSFRNWELIIVDDCSDDMTPEIIKEYSDKDKRIKIYRNNVNSKLPTSLNNGFNVARGEYLTWTSDDNILKENCLYVFNDYLDKHEDVMLVYSDYDLIDENSEVIGKVFNKDKKWIPVCNPIGASFMYRKAAIKKIGEYNSSLFLVEDYEYWIRVYLDSKIVHLNLNLYQYREHNKSLTSLNSYKIFKRMEQLREMYYFPLLNSIEDDEILAEFYASNRLYGIKVKRFDEVKLTVRYPKYIWLVMKKKLKRVIYKIKFKSFNND